MKKTNARGFTLVELSVVMALVAILLVMIVSFTSLTSLHTQESAARGDFMAACTDYRTAVTEGFALIDTADAVFSWSVSAEGVLTVGSASFALPEHIDTVTAKANGTLLRVTMVNEALSLSESFVIASHCGATFEVTEEDGGA